MPSPVAPLYKPAIDYEKAVVAAVKKAAPAVVAITITKDVPVIENCPGSPFWNLPPEFEDFFGNDLTQFYVPCEKGTKPQKVGGGSGFIMSADGLILTNKHVVNDPKASYTVFTNDGKKHDAQVLARPSKTLQFESRGEARRRWSRNSDPCGIGTDRDCHQEFTRRVPERQFLGGDDSGLARTVTAAEEERGDDADAPDGCGNQPGNSGGPLLNPRVMLANTAIASEAQNVGFAIH